MPDMVCISQDHKDFLDIMDIPLKSATHSRVNRPPDRSEATLDFFDSIKLLVVCHQ